MSFEDIIAREENNAEIAYGILHGHTDPYGYVPSDHYSDNAYSLSHSENRARAWGYTRKVG